MYDMDSVQGENASVKPRILYLTIFAVAMGFLEAAVVIYLRELFYPEGFAFPLKLMTPQVLTTEYLREISTVVMLLSVSLFTARNTYEKFLIFLYSFGIWDIFYYVWLKVFLDWPPSFFTYDILFLIPVVWVAPVAAPLICSITMIGIAGCLFYANRNNCRIMICPYRASFLAVGTFMVFLTFIWDFTGIILRGGFTGKCWNLLADPAFQKSIGEYIPGTFQWPLFIAGEVLIVMTVISFCKGMQKKSTGR